ncbi:substrate-binding domain-containing protein [Marinivivus vitaminiproducens]|uniref:substrate-binding domain-containing protein n=1 Tax=Marinivivus vitaminiproducens TaxID=3035935 RepID=UPI0027A34381|nr:substrate-binding domain-containing protein [Geminicoccaceae bacterium SCSIO 64248]
MTGKSLGIRELAHQLDISIGTVSRALNGHREVNAETRQRVLDAARRLGYAPNQSGRSLRKGRTNTVALMMRTNTDRVSYGDTFFINLCEGLQDRLARHHLDLIILPCSSAQDQDEYLRRAVERRLADGFIISDTQPIDPRIDFLLARRIPFVALGRSESGGTHAWVDLDFEGVVQESIDRLAAFGHRRIALAMTTRSVNNRLVLTRAYAKALALHGIPYDPALVIGMPNTADSGYTLGERLLAFADRPSAILLAQEALAIGLYRRLGETGLAVGRDLSIIGFRENPACGVLSPPLTCFRLSLPDLGVRLAEVLIEALRDEPPGDREIVRQLWPMTLLAGESDGPRTPI